MSNIVVSTNYRCSDDCLPQGCQSHTGVLVWNSVSDYYSFNLGGKMYFNLERGEIEAMIALVRKLNRIDCIQI